MNRLNLFKKLHAPPSSSGAERKGAEVAPPRVTYDTLFDAPALALKAEGDAQRPLRGRVPFDPHISFHDLRRRLVRYGRRCGEPYRSLMDRLADCEPLARHEAEKARGASYKRLAYAVHLAGLSRRERQIFYRLAERIGMSDRFAGHLIASLKREREGRVDG